MTELLALIWLFLPAGLANTAPVLANNVPVLKKFTQPLDAHKKFRGKRILGSHKTVRGLLAGVLMGTLIGVFQLVIFELFSWPSTNLLPVDYGSIEAVYIGSVLGFGAIVGDAVKSFFKRQVGIKPGHNWFFFDQSDYIIGAMLISLPFFTLPLSNYLFVLFLGLILHPVINVFAWLLRLQDSPL